MNGLDFQAYPLWVNALAFTGGALLVWFAGTRLSGYAESISERTGIGAAFIGALLLGGVTSLPEGMTTVTASLLDNPQLAVNNIFGGVAMQVAILALADAAVPGRAFSSITAAPVVLLQGTLLVLVLVLSAGGILLGEPAGLPVGVWAGTIMAVAIFGFYLMHASEGHPQWRPVMQSSRKQERRAGGDEPADRHDGDEAEADGKESLRAHELPTSRLVLYTVFAALAILVAGFVLAQTGDALAQQTGLGSSFVGVALVAISTSLPEVSTTLAAARLGRYDMAFSNIFGANIFDVGLLFVADLAYGGAPILNEVGDFSLFGALLGIAVTTIFLAGLIQRRQRMVWRLGMDSALVAIVYLGGLFALYTLR